ncbi:MAG TPA: methylmalonyl-CoA mutase family protein [Rhizobiaceae bacterium]|nr:methylmalonyl-CoA mutase family protein [Rhizobiaceae bacterium]
MNGAKRLKQTEFGALERRALAEQSSSGKDSGQALVSQKDHGMPNDRARKASLLPRVKPEKRWMITQRVDDVDPTRANAQAREDLAQGATGLSLVFEGAPNAFGYGLPATPEALARALEGVALDSTHLRIDAHPMSRASVDWLVALLTARKVDPDKLSLSFGIDPAAVFAGTGRLRMSVEALLASMPQSLAHFFGLGVPGVLLEADGRPFHNAGATEAQELGIMLAGAVSHLRMFEEARQPLIYATPHIGFALCVDQDQLVSMAKIRAMRKLWQRAQEACSIVSTPGQIHAETSWRMMTRLDPETNILRTTAACFAAAAGGADSITILPHSIAHGLPDGFARRVARNTQLIMGGESHVDFVVDPAAGPGVEALTDDLCELAWTEFQAIEADGGLLRSLASDRLQARIREAREVRADAYCEGDLSIVGTTLYPLKSERPISTLDAERRPPMQDGVAFCQALDPLRIDETIKGRA